jgi:orotate phosphoribosyltransferase
MTDAMRIEDLRATGALMDGHFLLTSGRHGDRFMLLAKLLAEPARAWPWIRDLAQFAEKLHPDRVVGPAMGGVILAWAVASEMPSRPRAAFAEKSEIAGGGKAMVIRRGLAPSPGERVLVVEDAMTTGGSVMLTAQAVEEAGAQVVGVATLVDRRPENFNIPYPTYGVLRMLTAAWTPEDCPLCVEKVPLVSPKS